MRMKVIYYQPKKLGNSNVANKEDSKWSEHNDSAVLTDIVNSLQRQNNVCTVYYIISETWCVKCRWIYDIFQEESEVGEIRKGNEGGCSSVQKTVTKYTNCKFSIIFEYVYVIAGVM